MKLIILDRDGVINHDDNTHIKTVEQWTPIDGSLEAMGRLCQAGYTLVIATNQSGIGRGIYDIEALHAMHAKMATMLEQFGGQVDSIFFCPHRHTDNCQCRKPKDGMFRDIMLRYECSLTDVPSVGDSLRDIQAAKSAGASPVLVKTGNGRKTLQNAEKSDMEGVLVFNDLAAVADNILSENNL